MGSLSYPPPSKKNHLNVLERKYPLAFSLEESVRFFILEKSEHPESELFCVFFNNIKLAVTSPRGQRSCLGPCSGSERSRDRVPVMPTLEGEFL